MTAFVLRKRLAVRDFAESQGFLLEPLGDWLEVVDKSREQLDLPGEVSIFIVVAHEFKHFPQVHVSLKLVAFKLEVETQLSETNRAEGKWLLVSLVELRGPVHKALVSLAVPHREDMAELVTSCLNGSVLNLLGHLSIEVAVGHLLGKVRVVSSVGLDADPPAALGHAKDESPAFFGVQIGVGEHQEALILTQLDAMLQVFEDLAGVELLHFGVLSDSGGNNLLTLQLGQILLDLVEFAFLDMLRVVDLVSLVLDSDHRHTSEEDLENGLHVVDKHLLEVSLLLVRKTLIPHLQDDHLFDGPVLALPFEVLLG